MPMLQPFHHIALPGPAATELVFAHGWRQDHRSLLPLAQRLGDVGASRLLDLPGFGLSPVPVAGSSPRTLAAAIAAWLAALPRPSCRLWLGHSFGCRVGLHLAADFPHVLDGLVLIAAPGLPTFRPWTERIWLGTRIAAYKLGRQTIGRIWPPLLRRAGSADWQQAGVLRDLLRHTLAEDLAPVARRVACPVQLFYGAEDRETPLWLGQAYARLLPKATLQILPGLGHLDILWDGVFTMEQAVRHFLLGVCR